MEQKENKMVDKETFKKLIETQIKQWEAEIQELELRASLLEKSFQSEFQGHLNLLKSQVQEAKDILRRIEQTTEESWEQVKVSIVNSVHDIKDSIERTLSEFTVNDRSV